MPRTARMLSESGFLHIMMRGVNKQPIFHENDDYEYFIHLMQKTKEKSTVTLHAFCLLPNHVHLLLRSLDQKPGDFIQHIGVSYAQHYNKINERVGHLFQDRYKSEIIDTDEYFMTALRYIHFNPVKAGLAKLPELYTWSSYPEFLGTSTLTDTQFALSLFGSKKALINFHKQMPEESFMDMDDPTRMSFEEMAKVIYALQPLDQFKKLSLEKQERQIRLIRLKTKASIRQLEYALQIGKHYIVKALKE